MKHKKVIWWALLCANLIIVIIFWMKGSGSLLNDGFAQSLIALGRLAGLLAAYAILLQFFFMGRMVYLEGVFGLDSLSRIHHQSGKWSFFLIIAHPILLVWGYSHISNTSWLNQFIIFISDFKHVVWALVGLILFMLVIGLSIHVASKRLKYESWYFVHLLAYLAVFASFWHQISVGEDILGNRIFYAYWIILYVTVFASHIIFRFLRPLYYFHRHRFTVSRLVRENHNTVSVYISGKSLDKFPVIAGQFMIFRFLDRKNWWQAHPFSLSTLPDHNEIRITVKAIGDFTATVADIKPGTRVIVDGPYGVFTNLFGVSSKVLLIAGGIGITPIRSLIEDMLAAGKEATLLYANRTQEDIVFRDELDSLANKYGAKIHHVISHDESFPGEKGYIDEGKIKRFVPDVASRDVYLCGPVPMMESLVKLLRALGVPEDNIHYEKFSLA